MLTISLSSYNAHKEALSRIKQYLITSIQNSIYSLKSINTIRSKLFRLKAIFTSLRANSILKLKQYKINILKSNKIEN